MMNADRHNPDTASDPRWSQIVARDKSADGRLWYSVSTTGIYCRPSCPSRTANPENVTLHDTLRAPAQQVSAPASAATPKDPHSTRKTQHWSSRPAD
jgi:AraC family transcriptional regulator of adaptative response/methylated-DNA-[protein]-cysteine methyltransferase